MTDLNEIAVSLKKLSSALIFCHMRPDGDTLGSAAALCTAMRMVGIKCDVICESEIPQKYSYDAFFSKILKPEDVVEKYEAHIALDVAGDNLLGKARNVFLSCKKTYCIDHHISNERFAADYYVREAASTSIIVFELIKYMNIAVDSTIAEFILLGIVTDTGNFSHRNTDEQSLECAGKLVGIGADINKINFYMFKNQKKGRAKLYIDVMSRMRLYNQDKLAIITVSRAQLDEYGLKSDATEGFVDFPLSIEGVEVAVSVLESKDKLYKISFRSNGKTNVNEIAGVFGGGGHILASGCMLSGFYEDVIDKIVYTVGNYL